MNYKKTSVDRLSKSVLRWIDHKRWRSLKPIQRQAIPIILDCDNDVLICAATASGKTEAAFLPLITQLTTLSKKKAHSGCHILYVAPLKALINDQWRRIEDMCRYAHIPATAWHGDVSSTVKKKFKENLEGVLLITPESLEAIFGQSEENVNLFFGAIQCVVIDEWHSFLGDVRGIHLSSLLHRLEQTLGRKIRRIGISATLGQPKLARCYIRPDDPEQVKVLEDKSSDHQPPTLSMITISYNPHEEEFYKGSIGVHHQRLTEKLYEHLRGKKALVFATSRYDVELYAHLLKQECERRKVPNEFFPHHGSLSKEIREKVEKEIKKSDLPKTIICTSTLELGIDIGDVEQVVQIGCARSVASLRQRMGRSGRGGGADTPSRLTCYHTVLEEKKRYNIEDILFMDFMMSLALMELLIKKEYEPPPPKRSLELSTLLHQILSVIRTHRKITKTMVYRLLCAKESPFAGVSKDIFHQLFVQMESPDIALIKKTATSEYVLAEAGEKLASDYRFYAAFVTPVSYEISCNGKVLGTVESPESLRNHLIFSGQSMKLVSIKNNTKTVFVSDEGEDEGLPPRFKSTGMCLVDDLVMKEVRCLYDGDQQSDYLCDDSKKILNQARQKYRACDLHKDSLNIHLHSESCLISHWYGDEKNTSLWLALKAKGWSVKRHHGLLMVELDFSKIFLSKKINDLCSPIVHHMVFCLIQD